MGYGGIIKTVFRVAASVVGGMVCGPPCAAIGSAVATGATGGSFKEALMAGATSYIGASISQGISGSLGDSLGAASTSGVNPNALVSVVGPDGFINAVPAGQAIAMQTAGQLTGGIGAETLLSQAALASAGVNAGITSFGDSAKEALGIVNGVNRTPFDVFSQSAQDSLQSLGFDAASVAPMSLSAAGMTVGGLTTVTLNQALLDPNGAYDDILAQKYSPEQIQWLKREARNALSQTAYDNLLASTTNPGLAEEEFNKIIASGVERENTALGTDITEEQFNNRFSTPDLGQIILGDETNLRKQSFNDELGKTFDANPFESIDDDIINSIVQERSGTARQQIGNFAARGSLNATGGKTANDFLTGQEESAKNRVRQEADSILGGTQNKITQVRDTAKQGIDSYKLGDDLFDPTPFAEQRDKIIQDQQGSLGSDIRGSLGSTPLFDINTALQSGGRAQGAVSGTASNKSFLDAIAAREGTISGTGDRRGVGSRGSGAF